MKRVLAALYLSLVACLANAGSLVISPSFELVYEEPVSIAHSSEVVLFNYADAFFSHETLKPDTIYRGIDLSGLEEPFVRSLFVPERRADLPKWLAVLSEEQADAFNASEGKVLHKQVGKADMFAVYDAEAALGNIFLIDGKHIHHFQMSGTQDFYQNIIGWIKERSNGNE